ncbi:MAG TPA: GAF domain-containing protein, partial [Blastocatellia bacterium]|nr:GAF domain-containing protein [Blastocatellia bacterium]
MFFYNQRALFFAMGGLFLIIMTIGVLSSPPNRQVEKTLALLFIFWELGVILTLALHLSFLKQLRSWAQSADSEKLPPIFGRYFLLDFVIVFGLILCGKLLGLTLDVFTFLLVANTIVYSAYVGGGRGFSLLITAVIFLLLVVTFLLFPGTGIYIGEPRWFYTALFLAPLLGMFLITVLSVSIISWLRTTEHRITRRHLQLLGKYMEILAGVITKDSSGNKIRQQAQFTERQFRKHVREVLQDLCSHKELFWYASACLWFLETHKDRGDLLIPGPSVDFDEAVPCRDGIDTGTGFLSTTDLVLIRSMRYRSGKWKSVTPRFRADVNAPAAFIPLYRHGTRVGVLALYGKEGGPAPIRQEKAFLRSLGSIISNTMEQWEGRYKASPQREMDELFKYKSLDQVFPEAVKILQKYLMAAGCMVIFRRKDTETTMKVVAKEGFNNDILSVEYEVGRGQTGI